MIEAIKLAKPYARAVFEFALQKNQLEKWSGILMHLAEMVTDPSIRELLKNPKYTDEQIISICLVVAKKFSFSQEEENLIRILGEKKRLGLLPEILQLYLKYLAANEKITHVEVFSVVPLDENAQTQLINKLKKKLELGVEIKNILKPELIGGMIIKIGDKVIDGSVKSQLLQLSDQLLSGA